MPTSCKLYKLTNKPEYVSLFYDLFIRDKKVHVFDKIQVEQKVTEMKLYVEPEKEDVSNIYIDLISSYWNKDEGTGFYKYTESAKIVIFNPADSLNILGILAPRWLEKQITYTIFKITQQKNSSIKEISELLMPITLKLFEKEKDIQRVFPNITTLWIRDIQDIFITTAALGGTTVQASSEFHQLTKTKGGKIRTIKFRYLAYTFVISEDGLIMSYSDLSSDEVKNTFGAIIETLFNLGVIN
jgi:hypothetical protein